MSLKVCANACNRTRSDINCSLIDKYFNCEHEQCIKTTCDIFYCIHCGCNNLNEENGRIFLNITSELINEIVEQHKTMAEKIFEESGNL